jgi:uncharacterized repeat protein (TIGR02543 family)/LPXTG-motif cell wall-anchored protein
MKYRSHPRTTFIAAATAFLLAGIAQASPVHAVTIDVNSTPIVFPNGVNDPKIGELAPVGFSHRYNNVITVGGVSVDAIVTVISATGIDSDDDHASGANNLLDELDDDGSPGDAIRARLDVFGLDNLSGDTNFQGEAVLRVAFLQSGTQNAATLQNVVINVKDIDSRQFVEFAAISSYKLTNNTEVSVATNTTDPSLVTAGSTRFFEPSGNGSSDADEENWVQVSYSQMSFVDIKIGARQSGGAYFGIEFSAATFTTPVSTVNATAAVYTLTYDNNGSSSSAPTATSGSGALTVAAAQSRPGFTFTGWNTRADGTGIAVAAGSSFTPSANITLFAQWTAVATTTVAPTTTTVAPTRTVVNETELPQTGASSSPASFVLLAMSLLGLGFWTRTRFSRRTSAPLQ